MFYENYERRAVAATVRTEARRTLRIESIYQGPVHTSDMRAEQETIYHIQSVHDFIEE